MPAENKSNIELIKGQISAWNNRAEMARQQGNDELMQQALERKRFYENELAKLQEWDVES
ncbi:hypothetical protein BH11CYA1_BH11CYA1_04490 [soil metagenome]